MGFMPRLLVLLALVASVPAAWATAQISDVLVIDGKEFALNSNPLESQLQEKKWQPPEEAMISSANWRGYVATWEVKAGKLLLTDVTILVSNPRKEHDYLRKDIIGDLYPGVAEVQATWYTGALVVPDGKMTRYVHMGYGSSFDHYQLLRVREGEIVEQLSLTGEAFEAYKEKKFAEFQKTEEYRKAYEEFRKEAPDLGDAEAVDFIQSFFSESYLSK